MPIDVNFSFLPLLASFILANIFIDLSADSNCE